MPLTTPILALDVDGVIIDSFPKPRWNETLEADLGIKSRVFTEMFFVPYWHDIVIGRRSMMPILADILVEMGSNVTAREFVEYWHGNHAHVRHDVIKAAVLWQKRTLGSLVLATNQEPVRAKYLWEDLALSDHFDFMIVSCHLGATKPQPDYFQKADVALNRTHTQPILFLDDLKENIIGARSHGWIAHHVKNSDHAIEVLSSL